MNFSKQTLRTLIAIVCVSVSATTLQAGWLDWFRCGKRTAPVATTPVAVTATTAHAEEKEEYKDSKMPKGPQQVTADTIKATPPATTHRFTASADATVATKGTAPTAKSTKGRVQRFFDWLETKLSSAISIHKLSESAAVAKVSDALAPVFDLSDCPSLKHYLENCISVEEAQALCQYLAWKHHMATASSLAKSEQQATQVKQKAPNIVVRIINFVWKHPVLTLCGVGVCWQLLKLAIPQKAPSTPCGGMYIVDQGSDTPRCVPWVQPSNDTTPLGGNRTDGSYSVNLMWINKKLDIAQTYICPDTSNQAYGSNPGYACLSGVFKWANVSQGSVVNFWYDSALTPATAVKNTQALIKEHASMHPEWAPIVLRDIRAIPKVVAHLNVFSDEISVYFRSDLLRPIIALHLLSNNEVRYFVYSDVDINTPLPQKELFDDRTLHNLQEYGLVMLAPQGFAYPAYAHENSFQMISNHNHNLLKAMNFVVIEANIQRAYHALHGNFKVEWVPELEPTKALGSMVYHGYDDMFAYFLFLEGHGQLICGGKNYEPTDGLTPFGLNYYPHIPFLCTCKPRNRKDDILRPWTEHIKTKKVDLPPTAGVNAYA